MKIREINSKLFSQKKQRFDMIPSIDPIDYHPRTLFIKTNIIYRTLLCTIDKVNFNHGE